MKWYNNIVVNLEISDIEGIIHNRILEGEQIKYFPVIKNIIKDTISDRSEIQIPITLPKFTTVEDYDDLLEDMDKLHDDCEVTSIRLMGPSLVASFLGIDFDIINVKVMGKYMGKYMVNTPSNKLPTINIGRTQKSLNIAMQELKEYYNIDVIIVYEHPFIKFRPNTSSSLFITNIDILCKSTKYGVYIDNHIIDDELWLGFKSTYFDYILDDYEKKSIRTTYEERLMFEKNQSESIEYYNKEFIGYLEKECKPKYPLGKDNDWKILCSITKDHSLYYICQDFVLDLFRNMQKWWKVMDEKTFTNVLAVLKHFKELNDFIWENTI